MAYDPVKARALARVVDGILNHSADVEGEREIRFALFVADTNDGVCCYLSNAPRGPMLRA